MKERVGSALCALFVALASAATSSASDNLPPGVRYARPKDPVAIDRIIVSQNPMHAGSSVTGTVITTANAAAVTAQAGTYRINLPKVAPGTFRVTVVVPRLWWWDWRGNVTVTAIRSDGAKVTRDIPVEVLW